MIENVLIKTTAATAIDCSHIEKVTGIAIDSAEPENTQTRYLISVDGGKWRKYNGGAWSFANEQELTADSVLEEGNTKAELTALNQSSLTAFAGKVIDVAVAMSVDNLAEMPSVNKFEILGKNTKIKKDLIYSNVIELSKDAVGITGIDISKSESSGGIIEIYASVQNNSDEWSPYIRYDEITCKAKAIRFKAEIEVDRPSVSTAILNSVKVHHWQSGKSAATEGKSVLISKPVTLENKVSRAHAIIRHPEVKDIDFNVSIIFGDSATSETMSLISSYNRHDEIEDEYEFVATDDSTSNTAVLKIEINQKSGTVTNEILGVGNGKQQAFKLAHHARPETLQITGGKDWIFKEKTDTLLITTENGRDVVVSYDWIAETAYLTALACMFSS